MSKPIAKRIRGRKLQQLRQRIHLLRPLCAECERRGIVKAWTQLDHITPLFKGGSNLESNLQGLCDECHASKTRADLGQQQGCNPDGTPAGWHHWNQPAAPIRAV